MGSHETKEASASFLEAEAAACQAKKNYLTRAGAPEAVTGALADAARALEEGAKALLLDNWVQLDQALTPILAGLRRPNSAQRHDG